MWALPSEKEVKFVIKVEYVDQFQVGLNTEMNVGPISSSAPVFYYIDINSETDPKKEGILEVQKHTLLWIINGSQFRLK